MNKVLKITGKVMGWILGITVGLVIISSAAHYILNSIEKNKYKTGQTINVDGKKMKT